MTKVEEVEEEDEAEEDLFEAEVGEDNHSTKLRYNALSVINLDTFNMNVLHRRRRTTILK